MFQHSGRGVDACSIITIQEDVLLQRLLGGFAFLFLSYVKREAVAGEPVLRCSRTVADA